MNRTARTGLFVFGLLTLTGCGDTDTTLLRTAINYKSELIDQLMKVKDEESARKFVDYYLKVFDEKNKTLDDKWNKWTKDIEADFRNKKRVINFSSNGQPGDDQFRQDAVAAMQKEDERIQGTRMTFLDFLSQDAANERRLKREFARIDQLLSYLKEEKIADEKAKGVERPVVKDLENWPNLIKLKDAFKAIGITGIDPKI